MSVAEAARLGLAGAEERLFSLQLDSGQITNIRNILRLRIDYLSQLNTPAMLIASADVGLLSTLSYSYLEPDEPSEQTLGRMVCVFFYTVGCSYSLGASLWVLYTCNNLVNLATMSTLAAKDLKGVQGADLVIELRMNDVRTWYMLSLASMVVGLFAMILAMMELYIAIPSIIAAILCTMHAIHADHETSYYFEKVSGVTLDTRGEYAIDDFLVKAYRALEWAVCCCRRGNRKGYHALGERIEEVFERRYDRVRIQRSREEVAKLKRQKSSDAHHFAHGISMLKTTSSKGPISVLNTVAFERDPEVRRKLLQITAANKPTHPGWWVRHGPVFMCFKSEQDWRGNTDPLLVVDLQQYTVVESFAADRALVIALIPKSVLSLDAPLDATHRIDAELAGKSWYLRCEEETDTAEWLEELRRVSNAGNDDSYFAPATPGSI